MTLPPSKTPVARVVGESWASLTNCLRTFHVSQQRQCSRGSQQVSRGLLWPHNSSKKCKAETHELIQSHVEETSWKIVTFPKSRGRYNTQQVDKQTSNSTGEKWQPDVHSILSPEGRRNVLDGLSKQNLWEQKDNKLHTMTVPSLNSG